MAPFTPPFTPKLFRQHLDYLKGKRNTTSPTPQPIMASNSNDHRDSPSAYDSPSPQHASPSGRKRKAEATDIEDSGSKRLHLESDGTKKAVDGQLVPVVSRRETDAQLLLHQDHHDSVNTARGDESEDEFVDAEEDVFTSRDPTTLDLSVGAGNFDVSMDDANDDELSAWRADHTEPPSTFMSDQADADLLSASLFPELGPMGAYALDGDDIGLAEPDYGQEGIDDGIEARVNEDDVLDLTQSRPLERPEMNTSGVAFHDQTACAQKFDEFDQEQQANEPELTPFINETQNQMSYPPATNEGDQEMDTDEPDLDAFIAEANGKRPYAKPLEDEPMSEAAVEDLASASQPQAPTHIEEENGVHKLVGQDGQIDAFIVKIGATPECDPQPHALPGSGELAHEHQEHQQGYTAGSELLNLNSLNDQPDLEIVACNDSALAQSYEAQGYTYQDPSKRIATPPPPTPAAPAASTSNSQGQILLPDGSTYNVSKTNASTAVLRTAELARIAGTDGPVIPRDFSKSFEAYHAFHVRALACRPEIPIPLASHRYWIAILYPTKKPRNAKSDKDFMWMKGNRFSTVCTIWHNFSLRTMEEDFVLTCRGEVLDMKDQVQELDWFDNKFVVMRAVKTGMLEKMTNGKPKGLFGEIGVIPEKKIEVVELE
ncbi:hypothetical protein CB0940_10754 [Cercospora beticola]|uniref:Uncharacterized protein n=1 Tax=Cercospora beticola TaxID=122368 RepID=A0A2G5HTR2_CERBT|nr:hypothetical protein CB0940_10754 [Cercospora beticola]PIA95622.1 hypothetical protein CB0940_10754 [Cercospora beticola]WPB07483.1 hypothetical protein RHO25_012144 [Cercospora beticola]